MSKVTRFAKWLRVKLVVLAVAAPAVVQGQERDVPPGAFIYMREVPTRPAEGPGVPAPPDYVILGGKAEVFGALGISPVSDAEQAGMSASAQPGGNIITDTLNRSLETLSSTHGTTDASMAGERGSFVGSTIGQAMGSLQSALGAMRSALGTDR